MSDDEINGLDEGEVILREIADSVLRIQWGQGVNSGLDCGEPFHITEGSSGFCRSQLAPRTREIPQILSLALIEKGGRTTHRVSNEVMECGWGATPAQHTVNYGIKS